MLELSKWREDFEFIQSLANGYLFFIFLQNEIQSTLRNSTYNCTCLKRAQWSRVGWKGVAGRERPWRGRARALWWSRGGEGQSGGVKVLEWGVWEDPCPGSVWEDNCPAGGSLLIPNLSPVFQVRLKMKVRRRMEGKNTEEEEGQPQREEPL